MEPIHHNGRHLSYVCAEILAKECSFARDLKILGDRMAFIINPNGHVDLNSNSYAVDVYKLVLKTYRASRDVICELVIANNQLKGKSARQFSKICHSSEFAEVFNVFEEKVHAADHNRREDSDSSLAAYKEASERLWNNRSASHLERQLKESLSIENLPTRMEQIANVYSSKTFKSYAANLEKLVLKSDWINRLFDVFEKALTNQDALGRLYESMPEVKKLTPGQLKKMFQNYRQTESFLTSARNLGSFVVAHQHMPRHVLFLNEFKDEQAFARPLKDWADFSKQTDKKVKLGLKLDKANTPKDLACRAYKFLMGVAGDAIDDLRLKKLTSLIVSNSFSHRIDFFESFLSNDLEESSFDNYPAFKSKLEAEWKKMEKAIQPRKGFWGRFCDFFDIAKALRRNKYQARWEQIAPKWAALAARKSVVIEDTL